jgi:hypothetical protein
LQFGYLFGNLIVMFIHQAAYISTQQTFDNIDLDTVRLPENNILKAVEPVSYPGIPLNILRRMGRAVKMGVGVSLPLIKDVPRIDGIITGTANGGMEDCFRFLQQLLEYNEGTLTPTGFVQSTANAIASQIGLLTGNNGYNATHVHRGLAFENAVLDAMMLLKEQPESVLLLLGVEEFSPYNYNLLYGDGWYKTEAMSNAALYGSGTPGSIPGEGAAAFVVSNRKQDAIAEIAAIKMLSTTDETAVSDALKVFVNQHAGDFNSIDVFLAGENGDSRQAGFYDRCYGLIPGEVTIARFKHFTGEYATVGAGGLWLSCRFLSKGGIIPRHFIRSGQVKEKNRQILIYNNFNGYQHSFYLIKEVSKREG